MTTVQFAFWLQGFFELSNPKTLNEEQTEMVKKHLALVFYHEIDPSYSSDPKKQEEMNKIHSGSKPVKPTPPPSQVIKEGEDPKPKITLPIYDEPQDPSRPPIYRC